MKNSILLLVSLPFFIACGTVRVFTDYDNSVDFSKYKSFAYYKPDIDKVEISDLDKRRILRSLDHQLSLIGMTKSEIPDLLVSFSTQAREKIYVNNNYYWGWNPWFFGAGYNSTSSYMEGILYINFVDAKTKQLVWQGKGSGRISEFTENRDERIGRFVQEIISHYPPPSR